VHTHRVAWPRFECDRAVRARAHTAGFEGNQGNGRGTGRGSLPARTKADDPAIAHAEIQYRSPVSVSDWRTAEVIHGALPHHFTYEFTTCGPNLLRQHSLAH